MESQSIDEHATSMEMKRDNVHLYLLAGKQAVRIDMLENALNLSEKNRQEMSYEMESMQAYIQELEVRGNAAKPPAAHVAVERTRSDGSLVRPGEVGYEQAAQHAEEG